MKKSSHNNLLKYFDGTMNFDRIFIGCNRRLLLEMDCYFMGCIIIHSFFFCSAGVDSIFMVIVYLQKMVLVISCTSDRFGVKSI